MPRPATLHEVAPLHRARPLSCAMLTGLATAFLLLAHPGVPGASSASPGAALTLPAPGYMSPGLPEAPKDFAFIKEGDYFHLFWIRHDWSQPSDSTERDFGHAVSRDLFNWTQLAPVIPVRPGHWDNFHVWAPTILKRNGTFYMYYTGVTYEPYAWTQFQRIGLATSTDLLNWTRSDQPVLTGAEIPWTVSDSSVFAGSQFRDPFVMPDPTTPGRTLLYYVTVPKIAQDQLIVGVAQTGDLTSFSDVEPLWCTDAAHYWGWCESPMVTQHNGLYYLFASTNSGHPIRFRTAPSPVADSTAWSGVYRLWDMVGQDPQSDNWYASEVLSVPGHDYLAVVNGLYHRIDVFEMVWDAATVGFTLTTPLVGEAGVSPETLPAVLSLDAIPRTGPGPGVMFRATLPAAATGRVDLFDVGGRRVRSLSSGPLPAGETVIAWDGRLEGGAGAPAGVYFAALSVPAGRRVARVSVTN